MKSELGITFVALQLLLSANSQIVTDADSAEATKYKIGVGRADITGPAAEVNMMGYGNPRQSTSGIHFRLYSRAFIIQDSNQKRVCFVSADLAMIDQSVKTEVSRILRKKFNDLYTEENVMLSATHTHSGPGGYLQYFLYIITSNGFVKQNFVAVVDGIVRSIEKAHVDLSEGFIYYAQGELKGTNINRSPTAYDNNPDEEKSNYQSNTDTTMQLLKFTDLNGNVRGILSWFAVHPTSMNNTNHLISGDNKGYASLLLERHLNGGLPGQGKVVAAFANSNLGDVSPNIEGPHCINSGLSCDIVTSTCSGNPTYCIAFGPGRDMFESTKIIGHRQYIKAKELLRTASEKLNGGVAFVHQHVDMSNVEITLPDGKVTKTCKPAMGYSFAAGTTDGPGSVFFRQGTTSPCILLNMVRNIIKKPSKELSDCHMPKPILLPTGEMKFPYPWQPSILPTQVFQIGSLVIAGVPGEFSTMAGRRLKSVLKAETNKKHVVIAGLSNAYSSYVVTFEEYQRQRYEGGSTIFGPRTLDAYLLQYKMLSQALVSNQPPPPGPPPPDLLRKQISLNPGVFLDFSIGIGKCIADVAKCYTIGQIVAAAFIAGNPRNNLMTEKTFLTVERFDEESNQWVVIATDGSWETKFIWKRVSTFIGLSHAIIEWEIPEETVPGQYRIGHFGFFKAAFSGIKPYKGYSKTFNVNTNCEL